VVAPQQVEFCHALGRARQEHLSEERPSRAATDVRPETHVVVVHTVLQPQRIQQGGVRPLHPQLVDAHHAVLGEAPSHFEVEPATLGRAEDRRPRAEAFLVQFHEHGEGIGDVLRRGAHRQAAARPFGAPQPAADLLAEIAAGQEQ